MQRTNVISGLILCVIGLITLWLEIPMGIERGPDGVMSPRLVPNLTMLQVLGLSVCWWSKTGKLSALSKNWHP